MKKLSISMFAVLAIIFAVASAFTNAPQKIFSNPSTPDTYIFVATDNSVDDPGGTENSSEIWGSTSSLLEMDPVQLTKDANGFTELRDEEYASEVTYEVACGSEQEYICAIELKFVQDGQNVVPDAVTDVPAKAFILGDVIE